MSDYIRSESYIFANLCDNVSRALYEAAMKKNWHSGAARHRVNGGDLTLREIADVLADLGAHMEVTVKFIDDPAKEGKGNDAFNSPNSDSASSV